MPKGRGTLWFAAAFMLPSLVIFNTGPFPSLYNQALGLICWGAAAAFGVKKPTRPSPTVYSPVSTPLVAIVILGLSGIAALVTTGIPAGPIFCILALLACAIVVSAAAAQGSAAPSEWQISFIVAVASAAVINCFPAFVQILAPASIDHIWLEVASNPGRVSGNVRQPNLLATLLVWGIAALTALYELRRVSQSLQRLASCVLLIVIAATGSRVGAVEVAALAVWAFVDLRLSRPSRAHLLLAPVLLAVFWICLRYWVSQSGTEHGRVVDFASSRYEMWRQCLVLIVAHPWLGVGMGNFNFAWTLTPFDRTNPETFDHAHNLILHWAVELGIPITLSLVGLLAWSVRQCVLRTRQTSGDESMIRRFCLVMITLVLIHSMTEYPLWYAYFLLPTAFAWGIASAPIIRTTEKSAQVPATLSLIGEPRLHTSWLRICGLLMALGAAFAMFDYQKIVTIYHPWDSAPPIEARVAAGRKAILYGYLADRFAGTLAVKGTRTLEPYKTATRQLLDMRLLIAWSLAMEETGHLDKARYLAQRVKDFNDPVAQQFFSVCKSSEPDVKLPWQCTPPSGHYSYEDFL